MSKSKVKNEMKLPKRPKKSAKLKKLPLGMAYKCVHVRRLFIIPPRGSSQ